MTLVLVMGVPGSGKTTLCGRLQQALGTSLECVQHLAFDDFIESSGALGEGGDFMEKASVLRKSWERSVQSAIEKLVEDGRQRFVLLLDDVFYFGSMRRTFERMARAFGLSCLLVLVDTTAEEAIERNRARPRRQVNISEDQIRQIFERFEFPYSSRGFIRYRGEEDDLLRIVLEQRSSPHRRVVEVEPVPDDSLWKQLDLDLRRAVGTLLRTEKDLDGRRVSARKKAIFEKMKTDGVTEWDSEGLLNALRDSSWR